MTDTAPKPPELPRRFYETASTAEADGHWRVLLDGRLVRTPGRAVLAATTRELADAIAQDPIGALAVILPTWVLVPFLITAVLALVSGAVLGIYSSGLTLLTLEVGGVQHHREAGSQHGCRHLVQALVGRDTGVLVIDAGTQQASVSLLLFAEQAFALHIRTHADGAQGLDHAHGHVAFAHRRNTVGNGQQARRDGAVAFCPVSYTHLTLPTTPYV